MAQTTWEGFMDSLVGEEKLLPAGIYEVEVTGARPFIKQGEVQRGIFLDLLVTKGPQKDSMASIYISIPVPGDRRAGFWYAKKMAGFGDLAPVYASMPDDLEGGLQVLCAAITGKRIMASIAPGAGDYSNRNSLGDTKPAGPTTQKIVEAPEVSAEEVASTVSNNGAKDTSSVSEEPGF